MLASTQAKLDLLLSMESSQDRIISKMIKNPSTHRDRVVRDYLVSHLLSGIQSDAKSALSVFSQPSESIHDSDPITQFYSSLKALKDDHRRGTSTTNTPVSFTSINEKEKMWEASLDSLFSGEEAFGRVFDLVSLHSLFLNLPWACNSDEAWKISYQTFIRDCIDWFSKTSLAVKKTAAYSAYLEEFQAYLIGFFQRARPLYDVDTLRSEDSDAFLDDWDSGFFLEM
jgi:splicing factor 3A subunit 3